VYGPHIAMLYANTSTAQTQMRTLGHFFHPTASLENKLGLAASNYELTQAIPKIAEYLSHDFFAASAIHEERLSSVLLDFLKSRPEITICGEPVADQQKRVPTISFLIKGWDSKEFVEAVEGKTKYGFRWGHFYAKRLCDEILGAGENGVVRVSAVHYNTEDEIKGLVEVLRSTLDGGKAK
jgi:selenocysteine lyase/cysteine desulfurase